MIKYDLSEEEIKKRIIEFVEVITQINEDGTIKTSGARIGEEE